MIRLLLTIAGSLLLVLPALASASAGDDAKTDAPVHASSSHKVAKTKAKKSAKKKSGKKSTAKTKSIKADKKTSIANSAMPKPSAEEGSRLQRDIVFDGSNVNGQYHSAGEAVARVEQEKKINDLIGMRKDYKDRLSLERERLQRGKDVDAED